MEKKWRVGDLLPVQGAAMSQIGFVLYDEAGSPASRLGAAAMMKLVGSAVRNGGVDWGGDGARSSLVRPVKSRRGRK
jgi:hypothetical protein